MSGEDEFANRDAQGLLNLKPDEPKSEGERVKKAESMYMKMLFGMLPIAGQVFAWGTYFVYAYVLGKKAAFDTKLQFVQSYDLGWVFLSVWVISLARSRLIMNANAQRAGARVDRPDQHAYKIMDSKANKDAPLVMMANTGALGRFNRAQRGVFNTDESAPLYVVNTVLAGSMFGPVVVLLNLLVAYGRVKFGLGYTESGAGRMAGLGPSFLGETWISGLVLLVAIKALAGSMIPF